MPPSFPSSASASTSASAATSTAASSSSSQPHQHQHQHSHPHSRSPPLQPPASKPDAPALTRVFARGFQRKGTKSAMGTLPRPSPLRREVTFGDGSASASAGGQGEERVTERDKGKKRALDGDALPANGSGNGHGIPSPDADADPSSHTNGTSDSNKRPKIAPLPVASTFSEPALPSATLAAASAPTGPAAPSVSSKSWWSWSNPPTASASASIPPLEDSSPSATLPPDTQTHTQTLPPILVPPTLPPASPPSAAGELTPPSQSAASALALAAAADHPSAASVPDKQQTLQPRRSWFGSFGRKSQGKRPALEPSASEPLPPVPPLPPLNAPVLQGSSTLTTLPPVSGLPEPPTMQREGSTASAPPILAPSASAAASASKSPPIPPAVPPKSAARRPSAPIPIPNPASSSTSSSTLTPARGSALAARRTASSASAAPTTTSTLPSQPSTPPTNALLPLESPDTRVPTPAFFRNSPAQSLSSSPNNSTLTSDNSHGQGHDHGPSILPAPPSGLAGLNAGALRYTLSLPLLGRPKRSLGEVVRLAEGEGASVLPTVLAPAPIQEAAKEGAEKSTDTDTEKAGGVVSGNAGAATDPQAAAEAAWWWSYLGFASTPVTAAKPSVAGAGPPALDAAVSEPENDHLPPLPLSPTLPFHPNTTSNTTDLPHPSSASVLSADTSRTRGGGSVWYQPWYWYTAAPAVPALPSEGGGNGNGDGGEGEGGKTEAERVKEDALARSAAQDQPAPAPEPPVPSSTSPPAPSNPLTTAANMPMWVSFFSAGRNPARPAITAGDAAGAKGEMEVMDIDEDAPGASVGVGVGGGAGNGVVQAGSSVPKDAPKPGTSVPKDGLKATATSVPNSKPSSIKAPDTGKLAATPSGSASGTTPAAPTPVPAATTAPPAKGPASQTPEPPKDAPAPPLTAASKPKKAVDAKRTASAVSTAKPPPAVPNFILPTFQDVFYHPPLSIRPPSGTSSGLSDGKSSGALKKTMRMVNKLWAAPPSFAPVLVDPELAEYQRRLVKGKGREGDVVIPGSVIARDRRERERERLEGMPALMPRSWAVLGTDRLGEMRSVKRAVVVGIHGWFPGPIMRSVLGEPTGTSVKFTQMQRDALVDYLQKHDIKLDELTEIPLEGEGTIQHRLDKLYTSLTSNEAWMKAIHEADVILFATHSQGSIVTCHIMDRLLAEGHIHTGMPRATGADVLVRMETAGLAPARKAQRVVCLALCGIHLGPLLYLNHNTLTQPWIQYVETAAARELFEFQDSESEVSKRYVTALARVLDQGCKFVYVASLNDQVVPIYSGAFVNASHPLILRGLYIDGDAYSSTDFLTNLLVLCLRLRDAGLTDGGLVVHLSEATAGSLNGVGHSTAYEEMSCYTLAIRFLFETNHGVEPLPPLELEPFSARESRNDYEIPWILNELVTHPAVQEWFLSEIEELRAAFDDWKPKTAALKDIRRKLEPIKRKGRGLNRIVIGPSRL